MNADSLIIIHNTIITMDSMEENDRKRNTAVISYNRLNSAVIS